MIIQGALLNCKRAIQKYRYSRPNINVRDLTRKDRRGHTQLGGHSKNDDGDDEGKYDNININISSISGPVYYSCVCARQTVVSLTKRSL